MKTLVDVNKMVFSPPEPGCVLYLPGLPSGGSKIYDRSSYGNHGTITGAVWKRLPSGLWYLDFDGIDDEVVCNTDLGLTNQGTVAAWVYPETYPHSNDENDFIEVKAGANFAFFFGVIEGATDKAYFRVVGAGGSPGGSGVANINLNTWTYLVGTFNPTEIVIYVNGKLDKTFTPLSGNVYAPQDVVRIGERSDYPYQWDGNVALVRIYNRALFALEIQNIFNREKHLFGAW